ncbi:MAG: peptidoglycan-associated lipoprotein Pal [Alphaproteobacteria bacterium]|nr:peptidoglycan-associated lipoprotein Pal [Alphaproteobacteria bacterium]
MLKKLFAVICSVSLLSACASQKDGADLYGNGNGGWNDDVNIADLQDTANTEKFREETPAVVYFKLDSSDLTVEARENLAAQAKWLAENPRVLVVIEGRCDERGTREYNLALGERRAMAARSYLMAQGVPADRIRIISYGKEKPVVLGSTEDAWSQNRSATTVAY